MLGPLSRPFLMANSLRWAISLILLAAGAASLVSLGLVGLGRDKNFGFDYRVMHFGGRAWLKGRNPYDQKQLDQTYHEYIGRPVDQSLERSIDPPFSYPPHSAALFLPFSLLSLPIATYLWWGLNLVALAGVAAMTLVSLRRSPGGLSDPLGWSVPLGFIVGNPITANVFWQGQTSLIALAASMGGWFFSRRGNWLLAGVCLGLGCIKPQLCLFIVLWLLLERNWKALIVAALAVAAMSIYPMTVHGNIKMATDWLERLRTHGEFGANQPGFEHVVGVQSLLAAAGLPAPPMEPVGIAAVVGLWFVRKRFMPDDLLGLLMGLTVSFVFVHDAEYVALIPLFTALWLHFRQDPRLGPELLFLVLLFNFPRRIVRQLDVPLLSHWRTLVVLALLMMLLTAALSQSARASCGRHKAGTLRRLRGVKRCGVAPHLAFSIGLPYLARSRIKCREPTAATTIRIDADQIAQVQDLAILLRRMSDDRSLSGYMRPRSPVAQRVPAKCQRMLFVESPLRLVTGMDEEVGPGFEEITPSANVFDMLRRNVFGVRFGTIRPYRCHAAHIEPVIWLRFAVYEVQHHLFMVTKQRNNAASIAERKELVDDLPAVRPTINAIA